ncbi:CAP family protein [Streptomyces sp. 4F14]|uniref:CAP family protein n=1 Tax=Streptomyces sp. 4F14 TaxID=3394380 RepID=UPI003A8BAAD4
MRTLTRRALTTVLTGVAAFAIAAPAAPRASADPAFDQRILERTNHHRARHGVPALTLDPEITRWAQEWADHLAGIERLEHRSPNKYGENLHYTWRSDGASPAPGDVVDGWYNQVHAYTAYGREPDMTAFKNWGLFTQLVWKSATRIGVGTAKTTNGKTYVVVNFAPQGNVAGRFTANVLPPK